MFFLRYMNSENERNEHVFLKKLEVEKEKLVEGGDLPDKVPETQDLIQQNRAASSSQSAGKAVEDGEPSHNLNDETIYLD
ncbi:hypothetical protein RIF29_00812 [Crotalaria pallida]|uniref:Uncharacterized protein n=1 Tax=Crotalaria pallida TaxID=3830 RepID=A0AAN9IWZ9_CROPI